MAISVFDVLKILEKRGAIKATEFASSFCDCCTKTHPRQWYRETKTGDEFYICIPSDMVMVKYQSGQWGQLVETDLLNKLM